MRLLKHLNEVNIKDLSDMESVSRELYDEIKVQCEPFLKEVKGSSHEAKRGRKNDISIAKKIKTRTNRKPTDTPFVIHDIINKTMKKKFGWYGRSEGVFANSTAAPGIVGHYGKPYYFYPVGNFKYLWHPQYKDVVLHLVDLNILDDDFTIRFDTHSENDWPKIISEIVSGYKTTGLKDALKKGHEVMYKCKEYYMVSAGYHIPYKDI